MGSGPRKGFASTGRWACSTPKLEPPLFSADAGLLAVAEKAALDLKLAPVKMASGERTLRVVTGVIVTGDAFVASAAKKDALRKEFKADATEMEGAALAQICWQRRVPCLILRSLSDSAGAKAPENEPPSRRALPKTPRASLPVLSGVSKRNEDSSRLLGRSISETSRPLSGLNKRISAQPNICFQTQLDICCAWE